MNLRESELTHHCEQARVFPESADKAARVDDDHDAATDDHHDRHVEQNVVEVLDGCVKEFVLLLQRPGAHADQCSRK